MESHNLVDCLTYSFTFLLKIACATGLSAASAGCAIVGRFGHNFPTNDNNQNTYEKYSSTPTAI